MLEISHISKTFNPGTANAKKAIDDLSLSVAEGDFITVIGANGAGKSTLFNAIAGSFITDSGSISLDGKDITLMPEHKRAKSIGRLFQDPMRGTAPGMTIEENLALAAGHGGWLSRVSKGDKKLFKDKLALLEMGLEDRMNNFPSQLSGGEQQRVSIARALAKNPKLLLCDEPTGALDSRAAQMLLETFRKMNRDMHSTILMVTHDAFSASYCSRILFLKDGKIFHELVRGVEERREFLNKILDVLSLTGGELSDVR